MKQSGCTWGDAKPNWTWVKILLKQTQQFYGIERLMTLRYLLLKRPLIAESQMLEEQRKLYFMNIDFLPLSLIPKVVEGNALKLIDTVVPKDRLSYIIEIHHLLILIDKNKEQKENIKSVMLLDEGKRNEPRLCA